MGKRLINRFFDINKMPSQEGLLVFGISMSRIGNEQSAKKCFEYMENFIPKILKPSVGLILLYSDGLYMNSDEKASLLKNRFQNLIHSHKYEFIKLLKKHPKYIPSSVSYITWNQLILDSKDFFNYLGKLKKIYNSDKTFRNHVNFDSGKKKPNKNEINFILEEILLFYLVSKGKLRLTNDYIQDKQKWILFCYPGSPLKSEVYLFQKNFFKLKNPGNVYENSFYDLSKKILYDYNNVDLEKLDL